MKYILEVYEDSFAYEDSYRAESESPFPSISIGDKWDPSLNSAAKWNSPLDARESFVVLDIEHQIISIKEVAVDAVTKIKVGKVTRENW